MNKDNPTYTDQDPNAEGRKKDHIVLAEASRVGVDALDQRFYYEPMLAGHAREQEDMASSFLGHSFRYPIWVSSMTGGTGIAANINKNLALACNEFGLGMGLGSCRKLLFDDTYFEDFNVRQYIGAQPLYANLGIAQLESLAQSNDWDLLTEMLHKLQATGLIIHVNPLQEWLQPEGDRYFVPPIETIQRVIDALAGTSIIVKEVGQGIGPKSLESLMQLPIDAIEFAASGGTNFAMLELLRAGEKEKALYTGLAHVGHSAAEMVDLWNKLAEGKDHVPEAIISGGVKDFLDGYYLTQKCNTNAVYGQASAFLNHAMGDYDTLRAYVQTQVEGLKIANAMLTVR